MRSDVQNLRRALLVALAAVLYCGAAHASGGDDHSYLPPAMRPAAHAKTDMALQDTERKTNGRKGASPGRSKYARKDHDIAASFSKLFKFLR